MADRKKIKSTILRWLKIILLVYVFAGIVLYFLQGNMLFQSDALPPDYKYDFQQPHREIQLRYDSATLFDMIVFKADTGTTNKGAVIYFHGNRENMNRYAPFAKNFTKHGYTVFMMDYPGYGKSTGIITEKILYEEAEQAYKLALANGFSSDSIIIYGKSIGTGIAAYLAAKEKCKMLMLETPYYSLLKIAEHYFWMYPIDYMTKYDIPAHEFIGKTKEPVIMFHGTSDGTIPYHQAQQLWKETHKPGDEFITIEGGEHNNLNDYTLMQQKLDSLLAK